MNIIGRINVKPVLPAELARLEELSFNLWWTWNPEVQDIFKLIDSNLWLNVYGNPLRFIQKVSVQLLNLKIKDETFMALYHKVLSKFDAYIKNDKTWFSISYPELTNKHILYFSAEYGLNESLPIYSGGLGVLSGDHCKSASDLGLPFTAIGLFYKQGYFKQSINSLGHQETTYVNLDTSWLPVRPAKDGEDKDIVISVELADRIVHAKLWQVSVGRINLYLLDTDIPQNNDNDRLITQRLYGGDQETRIQQEILLGIGGIRATSALGIKADVYHINEGHSAFLGLELLHSTIKEKNITFPQAHETVRSSLVFTTHTPVPAGNDRFPISMMERYFNGYWDKLGISREEFLDLGIIKNDSHNFNMTVLAMKMSGRINGVSKLHGAVTRKMFADLWPEIPEDEVPISHITNGVHTSTWVAPSIKSVYDSFLSPDWSDKILESKVRESFSNLPDEELWNAHLSAKQDLITFVREKALERRKRNAESDDVIHAAEALLNPEALTIGFARRFATYKRAHLIFRNLERIKRLLNNPDMPVQLIFAGKAHPADKPAQDVIKSLHEIAASEGFKGKVVLLENYNMQLSRKLIQGADVWLNNPRRPQEASGTSGQKAALNGVLNFSILDGWWCEGYNGSNGWAIGDGTHEAGEFEQDNKDSDHIYEILEKSIIPMFFKRDENDIPIEWLKYMKESIKSLAPEFSTHRMVRDYAAQRYVPAIEQSTLMHLNNSAKSIELSEWKKHMHDNWHQVHFIVDNSHNGQIEWNTNTNSNVQVSVDLYLGSILPQEIKADVYYGSLPDSNTLAEPKYAEMVLDEQIADGLWRYSCNILLKEGGKFGYTFRAYPFHDLLAEKFELGIIRWA